MVKFYKLNITGFLIVMVFLCGIDSHAQSTFAIDPSLMAEGNFHFSPQNSYFIDSEGIHNEFNPSLTPSDFTIDLPVVAQDDLFVVPLKKSFFDLGVF